MPSVGETLRLNLQLSDGSTAQFPRVVLRDSAGAAISGSPADLSHIGGGLYENSSVSFPASTNIVTAQYTVYSDSGHTTINNNYTQELENFYLSEVDLQAVESGLTLRNALRLIAASTAGKLSGATGPTVVIRNAVADSKDRISATVDANGNRTAITVDLS